MSTSARNELPAGYVLIVTADKFSAGTVQRIDSLGTAYDQTALTASTSTEIGPFTIARNYAIISTRGQLTHTIEPKDAASVVEVAD